MPFRALPLRWMGIFAGLLMAGSLYAQNEPSTTGPTIEPQSVVTLPSPKPHWVYVVDPVFPHLVSSKIYIYDGDSKDLLGMMNTGYVPNMAISPDKNQLYVTETFFSRGTRGDRTDVVTFYDSKTLEVTGEAKLPKGRYLVVPKRPNADLTLDGSFLLSFNMAPAMSVSVVNTKSKKYLGDVETPGCTMNYPISNNRFVMVCADGSLATVTLDDAGKAKLQRGKPFFDVVKDPVFEHAAWSKTNKIGFFVSWTGVVYPVNFADGTAKIETPWNLVGPEDKGWRPGGWQLAAYHAPTKRLFVIMHEGGQWTHKQAGEDIWVFDTVSKKRVGHYKVEHHSISLAVTHDAKPLAFALSEDTTLTINDATSFALNGMIEGSGESPYLLYVAGD